MTLSVAHSPFHCLRPLVLASGSPRRREFLHALGVVCDIVAPPGWAEPTPRIGEAPADFAARAARAKAEAVFARTSGDAAVLGADTVVHLGMEILGKPADTAQALRFLRRLAGTTHTVRTACYLKDRDGQGEAFFGEARVRMGDWPEEVLAAYAATGEGLDKAGAYAVQGAGSFLVAEVLGSWSGVVGLPAAETVAVLVRRGIIAPVSTP